MVSPKRFGWTALLGACLVPGLTMSAWAAPAEGAGETGVLEAPGTSSTSVSDPGPPTEVAAPGGDAGDPSAPTAPADGASPPAADMVPQAPATAADPTESTADEKAPREGTFSESAAEAESPDAGHEKSDAIDPDLLAASPSAPASPPPTATRKTVEDPGAYEAAVLDAFNDEYRPAHNPGRLHVAARVLFANAGGDHDVGGRMGGAQVDVGQAWNRFGYALTASAWGGSVLLDDRVGQMNGLFGLGPSITFGRTALQQRGMIDLRLGYDFMYGVVNQRADTRAVLAPQNDNASVVLEQTENLLPHGPRAVLQLGLLSPVRRNYHHGFGVVFGYQGLIGSLRGDLPFTHMLVTGLQWWMG